jgi:deoxyribonuclease (pyrimidine dimer)
MGKGHVKFFYDKGLYLKNRHASLREEMTSRGFSSNFELDLSSWPEEAMNDWTPLPSDKLISVSRIINRLHK